MNNCRDPLLALERFDVRRTALALTAGVLTCVTGPLIHELGHPLLARPLSGSGNLALFPCRRLACARTWILVFAIALPDEHIREMSPFDGAVISVGDSTTDLLFTLVYVVLWPLPTESIVIVFTARRAFRSTAWRVIVIPIPGVRNDGAGLMEFARDHST